MCNNIFINKYELIPPHLLPHLLLMTVIIPCDPLLLKIRRQNSSHAMGGNKIFTLFSYLYIVFIVLDSMPRMVLVMRLYHKIHREFRKLSVCSRNISNKSTLHTKLTKKNL